MTEVMTHILTQAYNEGARRHPDADPHYHAAFANSVAYAVTGASGGYGGPSMREHLAARHLGPGGEWSLEEAMNKVEEICYGPLTSEHASIFTSEFCFDDPEGDKEAARKFLRR